MSLITINFTLRGAGFQPAMLLSLCQKRSARCTAAGWKPAPRIFVWWKPELRVMLPVGAVEGDFVGGEIAVREPAGQLAGAVQHLQVPQGLLNEPDHQRVGTLYTVIGVGQFLLGGEVVPFADNLPGIEQVSAHPLPCSGYPAVIQFSEPG